MQKEQLIEWLANGIKSAGLSDTATPALERPKQADHGDYATNIALQLAKPLGKNPREVATALKSGARCEPASAGLRNHYREPRFHQHSPEPSGEVRGRC